MKSIVASMFSISVAFLQHHVQVLGTSFLGMGIKPGGLSELNRAYQSQQYFVQVSVQPLSLSIPHFAHRTGIGR